MLPMRALFPSRSRRAKDSDGAMKVGNTAQAPGPSGPMGAWLFLGLKKRR
jgi:hypothetical protein